VSDMLDKDGVFKVSFNFGVRRGLEVNNSKGKTENYEGLFNWGNQKHSFNVA
jgi:hypothetical protein